MIFSSGQFSLWLSNYLINMFGELRGRLGVWLSSYSILSTRHLCSLSSSRADPRSHGQKHDHPAVCIQVLYYRLQLTFSFTCLMVLILAKVATLFGTREQHWCFSQPKLKVTTRSVSNALAPYKSGGRDPAGGVTRPSGHGHPGQSHRRM